MDANLQDKQTTGGRILTYRHPLWVRICHWLSALSVISLLITGAVILLAHPRLYWGEDGFFGDPAFISLGDFEYAEYLGLSRSVHLFAAWILSFSGLVYFVLAITRQYFQKTLLPSADQLYAKQIVAEFIGHLRLQIARGNEARRYNLFQKVAYLAVLFCLLPCSVLSGLAMSPLVTASFPELIELSGGRQSARTIHFLIASAMLLFFVIHLFQVFLVGFKDGWRAMTTGWHALPPKDSGAVPERAAILGKEPQP